ncbi:hypothetical protein JNK13_03625 [bacterium]|nr:hypothetical protein [bacterium]
MSDQQNNTQPNVSSRPQSDKLNSEGNACLGLGAGVGALGLGGAMISGAVCPLCIFVTPLLIGMGITQKVRAKNCQANTDSSDQTAETNSEPDK